MRKKNFVQLTLGSSQFSEGGSVKMVLSDENEQIRLVRLTGRLLVFFIYRSKLQTSKGEPEIDDVGVYLGLTSCSRVEACGICLCLDRFEEYFTQDELVEFKHCLISSDSRKFEKCQVEVAKMIKKSSANAKMWPSFAKTLLVGPNSRGRADRRRSRPYR